MKEYSTCKLSYIQVSEQDSAKPEQRIPHQDSADDNWDGRKHMYVKLTPFQCPGTPRTLFKVSYNSSPSCFKELSYTLYLKKKKDT